MLHSPTPPNAANAVNAPDASLAGAVSDGRARAAGVALRARMQRHRHALALLLTLAASLGVLALYQHPDILVTLADQLWSCF